MTPTPQRPWLVADIGGTNARFGLVTKAGGEPTRVSVMRCREHADLVSAVETYLTHAGDAARPDTACIAVAGPVTGDRFRLTNAHWDFSVAASRDRLGFARLELINDFTALALAVPHLSPDALVSIGGVPRDPGKAVTVIGPGTGLGVAGLVPTPTGWVAVPSQGGHVTVPAETNLEAEIVRILRSRDHDAAAESVLSGPGLARLYRCLAQINGVDAEPLTPEEIAHRGNHRRDLICTETVQTFCALLGAFARDMAVTFCAEGGVLLAGGILPSMPQALARSGFRRRFEAHGAMGDYLSRTATELIIAPTPALRGAAAWLADNPSTSEGALTAA